MDDSEAQKAQIAGLYQRVAASYGRVGPDFFAHAGQHMVEHLGINEGAQVLDVAAGRGASLFPAAQKVGLTGQVTGIDLSAGMVEETAADIKRRNLSNASMLQMDAEALTFPDATFDYALCGFAIFLFPHLERALAEFFRVLRPGGKLGIIVAHDLDIFSRYYGERITEYQERYQFPMRAGGGAGGNYADLPHHLTRASFIDVQISHEQASFYYANAREWWDARWTHGTRYALEHMTPEVLAQFQAEMFAMFAREAPSQVIQEILDIHYMSASRGTATSESGSIAV